MAARRSSSRAPARSATQNRKRIWARRSFSDASLTTTPESFDLLSDFTAELGLTATPPGITIGGVMLDYHILQQTAGAGDTDALVMGLRVSQEATLSSIDGPLTEQHHDWMWYQTFGGRAAAADGPVYSSALALGGPLRLRSKRRMDEIGMRLTLSFEAVGTATYSARIVSSVLVIMP
jgi:hypothetical protein